MPILKTDYSGLNYDEMAASIGIKPKHVPMLIGGFLEESNSIIEAMSRAIESKDYETIKSNAHSIKGSSGNLKFMEIYEMSKEMEHSAADFKADFDYSGYVEAMKSAIGTIPN